MFAIDWENPQLTKSGLDFRDWELILEHKNEVCLTLWPIEGEAEVCESQITVWPLMFSPLVCRVISPGTVCQVAVCGWGQCPSRASQSWSEPAYRKWLFISCSRTVTWAVRSPFPKVRPHFAIPWGMLPVTNALPELQAADSSQPYHCLRKEATASGSLAGMGIQFDRCVQ